MSTTIRDSRQDDADRQYRAWCQRGVDPSAVKELLPALVGPPAVQQRAQQWLSRNAILGTDLSPEGRAEVTRVAAQAQGAMNQLAQSDEWAGHDQPFNTGNRYAPEGAELAERLDATMPTYGGYPDANENARRIADSDFDRDFERALASDETLDNFIATSLSGWDTPG